MPKPTASKHGQKIRASITLNPDLYKWIRDRTGDGKEYATLSHAVERGIVALKDRADGKK